jgi:hypothetical protein
MKRKEVCTNIYIWADNPEAAKIKASGPTDKIKNKEGFEKIEYVWIDDPIIEVEEIEDEGN